jgi:hypothetical protein
MTDEPDDQQYLGLTPQQWCQVVLCALLGALLVVGGCRSGWRAPAQLPAIRPQ